MGRASLSSVQVGTAFTGAAAAVAKMGDDSASADAGPRTLRMYRSCKNISVSPDDRGGRFEPENSGKVLVTLSDTYAGDYDNNCCAAAMLNLINMIDAAPHRE